MGGRVKEFVLKVVASGPNPCPPIVGAEWRHFCKAAILAKKALLRPLDQRNPKEFYDNLERELLEAINDIGIGPQGFGGATTALKVHIESYPTHFAGLPVAVNISCHVTRHAYGVL